MIVRILGEGQFNVDADSVADLNRLDQDLQRALDGDDDEAFRSALSTLLARVRGSGTPLPLNSLEPSDLILPAEDAHVDEVRDMLGNEGLIPGYLITSAEQRREVRDTPMAARSRYAPDRGLSARMGLTMFLLGLLYVVLFGVIGWALGGTSSAWIIALVVSAGALWAQWYFSDRLALFSMRGRIVTPQEAPQLHAIVDRLCAWPTCRNHRSRSPMSTCPTHSPPADRPSEQSCARPRADATARRSRARGRAVARALPCGAPRRHGDDHRVVRGGAGRVPDPDGDVLRHGRSRS